jgi:hypothetical protein
LTADPEKAEECFVAGLEDSIQANPVFKEWARSWSKRMIIKSAIRLISPGVGPTPASEKVSGGMFLNNPPCGKPDARKPGGGRPNDANRGTRHFSDLTSIWSQNSLLDAVLELEPLQRFVFVISTLEGYSTQECSILLNCTRQEIEEAKAHAVQRLAAAAGSRPAPVGAPGERFGQPFFLNLSLHPDIHIVLTGGSGRWAKAGRKPAHRSDRGQVSKSNHFWRNTTLKRYSWRNE